MYAVYDYECVTRVAVSCFFRGLKVSGSKKELVKVLQEVMRREEEENGGKALKACRGEDCQCVRDGKLGFLVCRVLSLDRSCFCASFSLSLSLSLACASFSLTPSLLPCHCCR